MGLSKGVKALLIIKNKIGFSKGIRAPLTIRSKIDLSKNVAQVVIKKASIIMFR